MAGPFQVVLHRDLDSRPRSALSSINAPRHAGQRTPNQGIRATRGRRHLVALLARGNVRVDPARHEPALDGVDHGAMQLIFTRRRWCRAALPARSEQVQLPHRRHVTCPRGHRPKSGACLWSCVCIIRRRWSQIRRGHLSGAGRLCGRFGRAWCITAERDANYDTLIRDLMDGQYSRPTRIVAFNTAEGFGHVT